MLGLNKIIIVALTRDIANFSPVSYSGDLDTLSSVNEEDILALPLLDDKFDPSEETLDSWLRFGSGLPANNELWIRTTEMDLLRDLAQLDPDHRKMVQEMIPVLLQVSGKPVQR